MDSTSAGTPCRLASGLGEVVFGSKTQMTAEMSSKSGRVNSPVSKRHQSQVAVGRVNSRTRRWLWARRFLISRFQSAPAEMLTPETKHSILGLNASSACWTATASAWFSCLWLTKIRKRSSGSRGTSPPRHRPTSLVAVGARGRSVPSADGAWTLMRRRPPASGSCCFAPRSTPWRRRWPEAGAGYCSRSSSVGRIRPSITVAASAHTTAARTGRASRRRSLPPATVTRGRARTAAGGRARRAGPWPARPPRRPRARRA